MELEDNHEELWMLTSTTPACLENFAKAVAEVWAPHRYCHACWRGYVAAAADDGARCLALRILPARRPPRNGRPVRHARRLLSRWYKFRVLSRRARGSRSLPEDGDVAGLCGRGFRLGAAAARRTGQRAARWEHELPH
jgi:hypothetical protein